MHKGQQSLTTHLYRSRISNKKLLKESVKFVWGWKLVVYLRKLIKKLDLNEIRWEKDLGVDRFNQLRVLEFQRKWFYNSNPSTLSLVSDSGELIITTHNHSKTPKF